MKQILIIGMIALLAIAVIGAGAYFVNAAQEPIETLPKTCGSCDGSCSSTASCGQASCQLNSEGSCGCARRV